MPVPPVPPLDETITPGQLGHIADHDAIHDALNNDTASLSADQTLAGVNNIATIRVKDKPWVDPTHPSFGMTTGAADNTAALQAACDAAFANSVDVLTMPLPEPDSYAFTGTVDLTGLDGLKIGALGGGKHTSVRFANAVNDNPIFLIDGETAADPGDGFVFERLKLEGYGLRATAVSTSTMDRCLLVAASGGVGHAMQLENSWGWKFKHCGFTSRSTTYKAVKLIGRTPNVDVGICYLIDFEDCQFTNGGVLYDQQATGTISLAPIRWRTTITEGFSASLSSLLEIQAPAATNLTLNGWVIDGVEHYDATGGTPPMIRHLDGTISWRGLAMMRVSPGAGSNFVQVEASTRFPSFYDTLMHGGPPAGGQIVTSDGVTEYNVQYGTTQMQDGGLNVISRTEYSNFSDTRSGAMPLGVSKAGDRHRSFGVDFDGSHRFGPTGATGSGNKFDTVVRRGGVGFMAVPMLVKAGVPADGDYATAPPDGTLAINSSTSKIYARIGGVWTQVTA